MLKSFSWQDFLLAATLLTLVWYIVVWLSTRKTGKHAAEPLSHSWENEFDEIHEVDGLMGKSALEHGVSEVTADDFSFSVADPPQELDRPEQLGNIADVQQDIKAVCAVLAIEDGSKSDFFLLFETVKNRYPKLSSSTLVPQLNIFITEHVPFHLDQEELDQLWI